MLCGLTGEYHIPLRNLVVAKEVVEATGEATLHSGAARHASSEGHIAGESNVKTLDGHTEFSHFQGNAIDVASPGSTGACRIVEVEIYTVFEVNGIGHDSVLCVVDAHLCHNGFVNSSGKYETTVIVGVLANEVDTSRRGIYIASLTIEVFDETTSY